MTQPRLVWGRLSGVETLVPARVLLVEDDDAVREGVASSLEARGFSVRTLTDGLRFGDEVDQYQPDVIVLDVGLPRGPDGFELASSLAEESRPPIVFLTAADSIDDRLRGFELGAEDYLVKPFSTRELEARLRVVLRRWKELAAEAPLVVDARARTATRAGKVLSLTPTEFELLAALASEPNRVWSKRELITRVWETDHYSPHVVEVYISSLRKKLEQYGPRVVLTHRGGGYSLLR